MNYIIKRLQHYNAFDIAMNNLLDVVNRRDLLFTHGTGGYLFEQNGDKYLDCVSGIAVNTFGHADPKLAEIIADQATKMLHISNYFRSNELEYAATRLSQLTIAGKVFFLNSGTESVETAIKIARRYFYEKSTPQRHEIICFQHAFHGRTFAALAAQGNEKYLEGFEPRLPGFHHAILNDLESVKSLISSKTAAIMLEPIQGEGGVTTCTQEFLNQLRKICDEMGILLIFDEVQCGVGRSGKLYAYQGYQVAPDILITAKGLGGGYPIGAVICTNEVASAMKPGSHGSTFGCNPMAARIAGYVLDTVSDEKFLANVMEKSRIMREIIAKVQGEYPEKITQIRGKGLLIGVRIGESFSNREFMNIAGKNRLLLPVSAYDNVVRVLPRLNISDEEISDFEAKFTQSITDL